MTRDPFPGHFCNRLWVLSREVKVYIMPQLAILET